MIKRLGNVLYWLGCGLSVLWLLGCGVAMIYDPRANVVGVIFVPLVGSILIWLVGRACRYVLSGN